jgi:histidinol-phosphate aminotransferase
LTGGYEPGRPSAEVLQGLCGAGPLVALSSNENPLGPSPQALRALSPQQEAHVHLYPDTLCHSLRQRLAALHRVEPGQIAVGPGTTDLIYHLVRQATGGVLAPRYTFVAYRLAARAGGLAYREVDGLAALAQAADEGTGLVCLANPGNPTGQLYPRGELVALLEALPTAVTVLLDEAYHEYVDPRLAPDGIELARAFPSVVVLRTFSKAYGLAALRVGYALGAPERIARLDALRPPFAVAGPAQAAALAALDDQDHVRRTRELVARGRTQLAEGLTVSDSHGNFVLVHLGPAAGAVWEDLARSGVLVRRLEPYGLLEHLRVTVGTAEQNHRFLLALARALAEVPR